MAADFFENKFSLGGKKNLRSKVWKGPVPGADPAQRPGGVGFGS